MLTRLAENRRHFGNSLIEYVLLGSLLLSGTIPFIVFMGRDFEGSLSGVRDDMRHKTLVSGQAKAVVQPVGTSEYPGYQQEHFPGSQTCFSNGWCLGIDTVTSANPGDVALTTGANGSQSVIQGQVSILQDIAVQAAKDPTTDPLLVDILTQLANAGHGVGNNMNNTFNKYNSTGFGEAYNTFWQSSRPFIARKEELTNYLKANPTALPLEVQSILNGAVGRIDSSMAKFIGSEGPSLEQWAAEIGNTKTSRAIHGDSNTVCSKGGNTQRCVQ